MKKVILVLCLMIAIAMQAQMNEKATRNDYLQLVEEEDVRWYLDEVAAFYDVPLDFAVRMIFLESNFGRYALRQENNGSKSYGWMQLNNQHIDYLVEKFYTYDQVGQEFDINNVFHNIQVGMAYYRYLFDQTGSWYDASLAYKCGARNVFRNKCSRTSKDYALFIVTGVARSEGFWIRGRCEEFEALMENS